MADLSLARVLLRGRIQSLRTGLADLREAFPGDPGFELLAQAEEEALQIYQAALARMDGQPEALEAGFGLDTRVEAAPQTLHPDHPGREKAG